MHWLREMFVSGWTLSLYLSDQYKFMTFFWNLASLSLLHNSLQLSEFDVAALVSILGSLSLLDNSLSLFASIVATLVSHFSIFGLKFVVPLGSPLSYLIGLSLCILIFFNWVITTIPDRSSLQPPQFLLSIIRLLAGAQRFCLIESKIALLTLPSSYLAFPNTRGFGRLGRKIPLGQARSRHSFFCSTIGPTFLAKVPKPFWNCEALWCGERVRHLLYGGLTS